MAFPSPMRTLTLVLFAALLVGCDAGAPETGATGTWEGEVLDPTLSSGPRYPLRMRLSDTGTRITGEGTVTGLPGGVFTFTVTDGQFVGAALSLALRFDATPINGSVSGTLVGNSPARFEGAFNGRGDVPRSFSMRLTGR